METNVMEKNCIKLLVWIKLKIFRNSFIIEKNFNRLMNFKAINISSAGCGGA
jgi:hypothetical protein